VLLGNTVGVGVLRPQDPLTGYFIAPLPGELFKTKYEEESNANTASDKLTAIVDPKQRRIQKNSQPNLAVTPTLAGKKQEFVQGNSYHINSEQAPFSEEETVLVNDAFASC